MDVPFPTTLSKNLYFRSFQMKDAHEVFRLFSDPETMSLDGGEKMDRPEEAYEFIHTHSNYIPGQTIIRWAVESRHDGRFFGSCGFHKIDHYHKRAEIGGELMKPFRHVGLATEAMYHLMDYGFRVLKLNRLTAMVSPLNKDAIALIERGPFIKEGCLRDWEKWKGQWVDLNVYGLLKREWVNKTMSQ